MLFAQCKSIYQEYLEIAYSRKLKSELRLVERIKEDTVYVIWFNATVHNADKDFPHVLWYHQGDTIVAYSIKTFSKKRYIILDTIPSFLSENSQHLECFDKGGWDLLSIYSCKNLIKSTIIDQECILKNHAESDMENRLQHDISLLREHIPEWIACLPATQSVDTCVTTTRTR